MKTAEIRKLFLNYFAKQDHKVVKSSSIIPYNDKSLLFTNAGMVQFKDVFLGIEKKDYQNATSSQKCLRAGGKHNDLDNVGYTNRHHTFFEMLGNFSFGGYFKEQAILYAWEFIIKELQLPEEKLLVTVYDKDIESFNLWKKIAGFSDDRIIKISSKDNFWEMGAEGPCGPCTEIFYDYGEEVQGGKPGTREEDGGRFIEFWNIVFMQYQKQKDGNQVDLATPSVDTGMGLERMASIIQGKTDNYDIDIFQNIIKSQEDIFKVKVNADNKVSFKVIADHIRASSFMIAEGILPSNEGRGYVLRRILRRAVRYSYMMGKKEAIIYRLFDTLKQEMQEVYPELGQRGSFIIDTIKNEEERFLQTCGKGIKLLQEEITKIRDKTLAGDIAFKLYDTYGFPLDLTEDILRSNNLKLDKKGFDEAFTRHKELAKKSWKGSGEIKDSDIWFKISENISKATEFVGYDENESEAKVLSLVALEDNNLKEVKVLNKGQEGFLIVDKTPFYAEMGGQIGDSGDIYIVNKKIAHITNTSKKVGDIFIHKLVDINESIKIGESISLKIDIKRRRQIERLHSATHLLHDACVVVLGDHISQQGAMITEEKLRFDISNEKALTKEELQKIEDLVNEAIMASLPVKAQYMKLEEAISQGATALFGEKYPDIARCVIIGEKEDALYSFELCGGTHIKNTSEIGLFKIISESSKALGVRRIEAICSLDILRYLNLNEDKLSNIANIFSSNINVLEEKATSIIEENKKIKKDYNNLNNKYYVNLLKDRYKEKNGISYLCENVKDLESKDLRNIAISLIQNRNSSIVLLYKGDKDKGSFLIFVSKDLEKKVNLKEKKDDVLKAISGTGGGSNSMLQGTCDIQRIEEALNILL